MPRPDAKPASKIRNPGQVVELDGRVSGNSPGKAYPIVSLPQLIFQPTVLA